MANPSFPSFPTSRRVLCATVTHLCGQRMQRGQTVALLAAADLTASRVAEPYTLSLVRCRRVSDAAARRREHRIPARRHGAQTLIF